MNFYEADDLRNTKQRLKRLLHLTLFFNFESNIVESAAAFNLDHSQISIWGMAVAIWLIVVACLWGVTNPFIKRGSQGIESIQASTPLKQFLAELSFLVTNIKYLVPFLINQSGSVVYYLTLSSADLSLAVPITNSLTFIFTGITGHVLGEKISSKRTILGMLLVVAGVTLCVLDKV